MKMKVWFSILAVAFLLILSACGTGGQDGNEDNTQGNGNTDNTENTEDAAEDTEEKKQLVIGTDAAYAPFENLEKGQIVGFDVDFITAVLEEAGYEFEIKNTGWEPLFQSVENGDVDFGISAITITEDRQQTYDFSVPYFEATQMILVPEDSEVAAYADLKGLVVGVQTGTTGDVKVEELLGEKSEDIKKYETTPLAIMALLNGEIDAVVADNAVIGNYVANNADQPVKAVSDNGAFDPEFYGLMFKKGNDELREELNEAIKTVIDNGTYTDIFVEWFAEEPNIENLKEQQ
jgi:glutamine transport system substrate-binding protein